MKNVPDDLHRQLHELAERKGVTLRDLLLAAARREIERETFRERLAAAPPVHLGQPAAAVIEEERARRDREVGD
ncbi:MAG TPA: toxin-antitoxin system HicB family antitoxin [Polyangia bacterium]|jgi:hypothetical protein|nr:toxin-antitoxin system HicB family antitoxin [Polyangia bacterium]